jgi:hypothetical protein
MPETVTVSPASQPANSHTAQSTQGAIGLRKQPRKVERERMAESPGIKRRRG